VLHALFAAGMELGGAISGEHGLGTEKASYFLELEDPAKVALMRRVKAAFDPNGILNPGTIFG
jgi:glycolate oxidase